MGVVVVVVFVVSDGLFSVFTGFVAVWINTGTFYPGVNGYNKISCSTQLSMKFQMLIKNKMLNTVQFQWLEQDWDHAK